MAGNNNLIEEFDASSSWILEDDSKEIKNTITLDCSNKSVELDDIVQLNTCIHLIQKEDANNNEPCTVSIVLSDSTPYLLSRLVIVSEAKIIELSGKLDEYLTTCPAEYVDDFEDCAVYMADCTFKPTKKLSIKFQRTKHANNLWLYGIHIKLLPNESRSLQALSSIDYNIVNEMLQEAKLPISDNAERFKAFIQNYHLAASNQNQQLYQSKPPHCGNVGQTSEFFNLKYYIDKRFAELEKRIDRFEELLVEIQKMQTNKLDCIIELLSLK